MKAKLRQVECNEDELVDIPDNWIPVRLERNEFATPLRKMYILHVLERAQAAARAPTGCGCRGVGPQPRQACPRVPSRADSYSARFI